MGTGARAKHGQQRTFRVDRAASVDRVGGAPVRDSAGIHGVQMAHEHNGTGAAGGMVSEAGVHVPRHVDVATASPCGRGVGEEGGHRRFVTGGGRDGDGPGQRLDELPVGDVLALHDVLTRVHDSPRSALAKGSEAEQPAMSTWCTPCRAAWAAACSFILMPPST